MSRQGARWSELPSELLLKIVEHIGSRLDTGHLRAVCKAWSESISLSTVVSKNIISPLFPYSLSTLLKPFSPWLYNSGNDGLQSPVVVATSVFLFQSTYNSSLPPWIFAAEELHPGKLFVSKSLSPISVEKLPNYFPLTVEFSHIRVLELGAFHRIRFADDPKDMFRTKKHEFCTLNDNRVVLFVRPSKITSPTIDDCTAVVLHHNGALSAIRLKDGTEKPLKKYKKFSATKFDDIVVFKEKIYALDRKCRVYTMDYDTLSLSSTTFTDEERAGEKRKRLAVSNDGQQLYMIYRVFNVRTSTSDEMAFKVDILNEGEKVWEEVDGIDTDKLLFVTFDGCFFASVKDFPGWKGNCIVFYRACFASYSSPTVREGVGLLSVYDLNARQCQYLASYHSSSNLFWPPPNWLASHATHMSKREKKEDNKSADGKNQGAPARLTNAELIPSSITCSVQQSNKSDGSTVKFKGLNIRSNVVETLQRIWSEHGNLMENSLIHTDDMLARALESLVTAVLILEETSVGSLSESQADYLISTLTGLQRMRFKVDWLIPYVNKVIQLLENKPLKELLHRQAEIAERRSKLNKELAELDKLENQVKEDVANASKFTPFSGNDDLYQPAGWGLP